MEFKLHNGSGGLCCKSCGRQDKQLNTYDWLADIPGNAEESEMVEIQFKNTRKGYFRNSNKIPLEKGDIVAVEATPGHDIGVVTLTGRLVPLQMRKANIKSEADIKRIYRKAKQVDMDKYNEAKAREHSTMIRARQIALDLNLNMKIGDVEYQGDGNKAIFYYIADERVDFRQLIKVLAEAFRVRIEMKQIGARQEAGRIGGIGPCGRELCCATWMTSFVSSIRDRLTESCSREMDGVGLNAARNTTGMPVEMPPKIPPQLFVSVTMCPFCTRNGSLFSLPRSRAAAKPAPNSTPLTAGMPNSAEARRFSMPSNIGSPRPAGSPMAAHSTMPPTESCASRAAKIRRCIRSPAASEMVGNGFAATARNSSSVG